MEYIWYIIAALGAGIGTGLAGLSAATVMVPMEVRENRRELEQVMDAAIDAVTQEADEQEAVMESPVLEKKHNQERS